MKRTILTLMIVSLLIVSCSTGKRTMSVEKQHNYVETRYKNLCIYSKKNTLYPCNKPKKLNIKNKLKTN